MKLFKVKKMTFKTEEMISAYPLLRGELGVCQLTIQSFFQFFPPNPPNFRQL